MFLLSCAGLKSYPSLEISTNKRVIEVLRSKSEDIQTIHATLGLTPSTIAAPELNAYMTYHKEGLFKLTGLAPNGLTLFVFETEDNRFDLMLSNGRSIRGDMDEFITGIRGVPGLEFAADLGIVKEVIDFYGGDLTPDASFFIEKLKDDYILTQLRSRGGISYPLRRWWIERGDMNIVKKEIYSKHQDNPGERLFEALYGDFRMIDGIWTPFEILVKDGEGRNLLKMKFHKVEYNK